MTLIVLYLAVDVQLVTALIDCLMFCVVKPAVGEKKLFVISPGTCRPLFIDDGAIGKFLRLVESNMFESDH